MRLPAFARAALTVCALTLFAGLSPVHADADSSAPATLDTSVLRATLDNGLRVVIVRNTLAPVVTTQLNYLVGSNEVPDGFPGTAHALEHMMFRGSPGLSRDQLAEISAQLGGDFNADTTQTVTQYYFTAPAADLGVALHIEASRMAGLDVNKADWAKERGAIEQEVSRDLSNPQYVFYKQLLATMFKGTPYAHDALGTRPSFDKTTATMLRQFHQTWYAPNNAILVIVGDVDPQSALAQVKTLFGKIPRKTLPKRPEIKLQAVKPELLRLPTDEAYGTVVVAYRMPGYTDKDYAAATLMADALDSRRGRLNALVPEGKALYAGFESSSMQDTGVGFALGIFPKGGDADALLKAVRERVAEAVKHGIPADLVDAARRQEIAALEMQKNSVPGLANAWSTALAFQQLDSPDAMKQAFEAVTVDDVNRVARAMLNPDHAITAILTPEPSGKPTAGKGFGGSESFSVTPQKAVSLPAWARTALAHAPIPQSALKPEETKLPNGMHLIVQPSAISDTVSVYGAVRNEASLQAPKGQEGVSAVLDELFDYGGGGLDRVAYQKALDDIAAQEDAGTQFGIEVPAAHFDRAVELLADNVLKPNLPEAAFKVVQQQVARTVAGQLQSPDYLFGRALQKALLPENDPDLREATPDSVMKLSLNDVRDYYRQVFRPDLTTVVVIGNVTPEAARKVIAKYFGNWKADGPAPDLDLPRVPANKPSQAVVPDRTSVQDTVVLAGNVDLTLHDADHYALSLGNQILGQGFYASRLYRDLRARSGLVYTVGSDFKFGRTRSHYTVSYGCDPGNVSKAREIVMRDLEAMQKTPVTDAELTRAKAMVLRRIPLQEDSVHHVAQAWLYYNQHGLPLDQATVAARHYAGLSAADIQAAYHKWLRPRDFVEVVKGPTPK